MNDIQKKATEKMVEKFQCPGCMLGSDIKCGKYKLEAEYGAKCMSQAPGTFILGVSSHIFLGLPIGFNKSQMIHAAMSPDRMTPIRLWLEGTHPEWNKLNVAVWAMEEDGYLFVRTAIPRRGQIYIDIIKKGTLALCPGAINVAEFKGDID